METETVKVIDDKAPEINTEDTTMKTLEVSKTSKVVEVIKAPETLVIDTEKTVGFTGLDSVYGLSGEAEMKPMTDERNKNIFIFLKALKYLTSSQTFSLPELDYKELTILQLELEHSIKSGMQYNLKKMKEAGGNAKLKAQELASFYSKGDNLNLYSYLFFSKFPNIETVKFPTRGRNYNEKSTFEETGKN